MYADMVHEPGQRQDTTEVIQSNQELCKKYMEEIPMSPEESLEYRIVHNRTDRHNIVTCNVSTEMSGGRRKSQKTQLDRASEDTVHYNTKRHKKYRNIEHHRRTYRVPTE